jgi:hypothetical protein
MICREFCPFCRFTLPLRRSDSLHLKKVKVNAAAFSAAAFPAVLFYKYSGSVFETQSQG